MCERGNGALGVYCDWGCAVLGACDAGFVAVCVCDGVWVELCLGVVGGFQVQVVHMYLFGWTWEFGVMWWLGFSCFVFCILLDVGLDGAFE